MALTDYVMVTPKTVSTTETSIVLQSDTLAVEFRAVDMEVLLGFATGFVAAGNYITIPIGTSWMAQNRNFGGQQFFLDSASATGRCEVVEMRKMAS